MYNNKGESILVSMPKNLAWTQQHGGLHVTITGKVVVYDPAESKKTPPFSPLYPFLLCGMHYKKKCKNINAQMSRAT